MPQTGSVGHILVLLPSSAHFRRPRTPPEPEKPYIQRAPSGCSSLRQTDGLFEIRARSGGRGDISARHFCLATIATYAELGISSASNSLTLRSISSTKGRTSSTGLPAGSSSSQSM